MACTPLMASHCTILVYSTLAKSHTCVQVYTKFIVRNMLCMTYVKACTAARPKASYKLSSFSNLFDAYFEACCTRQQSGQAQLFNLVSLARQETSVKDGPGSGVDY